MMNTKLLGIWIDQREAILATGEEIIDVVNSEFNIGHAKGGSGSSVPYGPQDAISESKVLEKRKQSLVIYFHEILQRLDYYDHIYILGPGMTKNQLRDAIKKHHNTRNKQVTIETIDKITLNQIRAKIRDFETSLTQSI